MSDMSEMISDDGHLSLQTATVTAEVEREVRRRYQQAGRQAEGALCCPTEYDPRLIALLPQ